MSIITGESIASFTLQMDVPIGTWWANVWYDGETWHMTEQIIFKGRGRVAQQSKLTDNGFVAYETVAARVFASQYV